MSGLSSRNIYPLLIWLLTGRRKYALSRARAFPNSRLRVTFELLSPDWRGAERFVNAAVVPRCIKYDVNDSAADWGYHYHYLPGNSRPLSNRPARFHLQGHPMSGSVTVVTTRVSDRAQSDERASPLKLNIRTVARSRQDRGQYHFSARVIEQTNAITIFLRDITTIRRVRLGIRLEGHKFSCNSSKFVAPASKILDELLAR
ncbi:hypothetical protein FPV67DRAFT_1455119 [Lyophyllum atratum]|nr:hypothetical protein FPV67DRAFT_1455119 [Lyophyllum atratum]